MQVSGGARIVAIDRRELVGWKVVDMGADAPVGHADKVA